MIGRDRVLLLHMLEAIEFIETHRKTTFEQTLLDDQVLRLAIERQLEIIGEAANALSEDITNTYQQIEWRKIVQFRNFLAHEYFGIDYTLVWNIIESKLPELKVVIVKILEDNS